MPTAKIIPVDSKVDRTVVIVSRPTRLGMFGGNNVAPGVYAVPGDLRRHRPSMLDARRIQAGHVRLVFLTAEQAYEEEPKEDKPKKRRSPKPKDPNAPPKARKPRKKKEVADKPAESTTEEPAKEAPVETAEAGATITGGGDEDATTDSDAVQTPGEAGEGPAADKEGSDVVG